jgi:hypothetical protein
MKSALSKRKWFVFAGGLGSAIVLVAIACANFLPDQTWHVLNTLEITYAGMISRMTPIPTGADRTAEEDNIREAIVRDWAGPKGLKRLVFVSIDGHDPSDEFLARFADLRPTLVKKASEQRFDIASHQWVDQSTGERGVSVSVNSIKWLFGDRAEAEVAMRCGSLCGVGGVCEMVKKKSRWTREALLRQWVS